MQRRIGIATPTRRRTAGCRLQRELGLISDSANLPGGDSKRRKKKKDGNLVPNPRSRTWPRVDPPDTITPTLD